MTSWLAESNDVVLEKFGITKENFETFKTALTDHLVAGGEAEQMWKDAMHQLKYNAPTDQSTSVDLIILFALFKIKHGSPLSVVTTLFRIQYHATASLFAGRCFQLLNLAIGDHVSSIVHVFLSLQ